MNTFLKTTFGAALLCAAQTGPASPTLTIYDGVNPLLTISDGLAGDLASAPGGVLSATNVGPWNLLITSGATKPLFGTAGNPLADLSIQASSTGAGTLTFTFSDNGFGPIAGMLNASISGFANTGADETVGYQVFGSAANVVGATNSLLANVGANLSLPVLASASGALNWNTPFSLTEVVTLQAHGASNIGVDASFNVVPAPEPAPLTLAALGCALAAATRRKVGRQ